MLDFFYKIRARVQPKKEIVKNQELTLLCSGQSFQVSLTNKIFFLEGERMLETETSRGYTGGKNSQN